MKVGVIQLNILFFVTINVSGNEYSQTNTDNNEDSDIDTKKHYGDKIKDVSDNPDNIRQKSSNSDRHEDVFTDKTRKNNDKDILRNSDTKSGSDNLNDRVLNHNKHNDSDNDKTRKYFNDKDKLTNSYARSRPDYFNDKEINFNTNDNVYIDKTRRLNHDDVKSLDGNIKKLRDIFNDMAFNNYIVSRRYYYNPDAAFDDYERTNSDFHDATRMSHNNIRLPDYTHAFRSLKYNDRNRMNYYNGNNRPNYQERYNDQGQIYGNRYTNDNYRNNPNNYGVNNNPQMYPPNDSNYNRNNQGNYPINNPSNAGCGYENLNKDRSHYDYTRTINGSVDGNASEINQVEPVCFEMRQAPELYTKYLQDFEKSYETTFDLLTHYDLFKKTLEEINNLRKQEHNTEYGLNYVSDWSDEEFSKKFNSNLLIRYKKLKYVLR